MGLWDYLFGRKDEPIAPDYREGGAHRAKPADPDRLRDIRGYPTKEEVDFAKKYDYFYGTPTDAYVKGTGVAQKATDEEYLKYYNNPFMGNKFSAPRSVVPEHVADQFAAAHLAANRSPLAALGFDPRVMNYVDAEKLYTISGYTPSEYQGPNYYSNQPLVTGKGKGAKTTNIPTEKGAADRIFYVSNYPSKTEITTTPTHESIHRGIGKVASRYPGMTPSGEDNEMMVRRDMYKNFANPEDKSMIPGFGVNEQIYEANKIPANAKFYDALLEKYGQKAQEMIAKQRPMGPR